MTPLSVVPLMAMLAGIGVIIDGLETMAARDSFAPSGLHSWDVLRLGRHYLVAGPFAAPLGYLFRYPQVLGLPVFQLIAASALLAAPFLPADLMRPLVAAAGLGIALARMLFAMRQQLGLDGADQMLVIALLAAGFGALLGNRSAGYAAVDYAALQLLLSYAVAGTAKAISPTWRSGRAIVGITGTIGYGEPHFHRLVRRYPALARVVCWSVIVFECAAAPLILLGVRGAWIIIVLGLSFHIGVALVMGLNVFVWAFAACYPALLLLGSQVSGLLAR
jgi:hypothetical protein